MEARISYEDGHVERYPVTNAGLAKMLCRCLLQIDPAAFRAVLVDEQYDRELWNSGDKHADPFVVGDVVFEGVKS